MNTKNNQRTRLSKILLKNAMMDLLGEKGSVEKISVRELCERAELNRSTFYAHYSEPKALLEEIEDDLLSAAGTHLMNIGHADDINAGTYILLFLRYIRDNDKQFRTLLVDSVDMSFKNKFMQAAVGQIAQNFDFELKTEEEQYIYSYILNGSTSIIIQWIRSGYSIEENNLVELLFKMNKNLLEGVVQ